MSKASRELSDSAHRAARDLLTANRTDLIKSLAHEGVYATLVEAGFHNEALSDEDAEQLTRILVEDGLNGLETQLSI